MTRERASVVLVVACVLLLILSMYLIANGAVKSPWAYVKGFFVSEPCEQALVWDNVPVITRQFKSKVECAAYIQGAADQYSIINAILNPPKKK